jgi:GxxExxY protein
MLLELLTEKTIGCCIEVHRELGPGLLESIYQSALEIEFGFHGMRYQPQLPMDVKYKGMMIGQFRIDLLVENAVVVELKSTERHDPIFEAQLLSYMKLGGYKVGLLVNFNSTMLIKESKGSYCDYVKKPGCRDLSLPV